MTAAPATQRPEVSVVVPVYRGAQTIGTLAEQLDAVLPESGIRHELIFVADSPVDDSWAVIEALSARFASVRGILLRRNYGQHPATLLGIREARGTVVVTMDEDLQHAPADVPRLVEVARTGRLVYGVSQELHHGVFRNTSSRLIKWFLARYLGVQNARNLSAFRAFPTLAREAFAGYRAPAVALDVLLSWAALPTEMVRCAHAPRAAGESGYTFRKLVALLANLAFGFSIVPLRIATRIGVLAVVAAVLLGCYVLVNWLLHGSSVPGFAFLAMTISLLGGAQLLALGLVGEYLGRLYVGQLGHPQYTVAARAETPDAPPAEAGLSGTHD